MYTSSKMSESGFLTCSFSLLGKRGVFLEGAANGGWEHGSVMEGANICGGCCRWWVGGEMKKKKRKNLC